MGPCLPIAFRPLAGRQLRGALEGARQASYNGLPLSSQVSDLGARYDGGNSAANGSPWQTHRGWSKGGGSSGETGWNGGAVGGTTRGVGQRRCHQLRRDSLTRAGRSCGRTTIDRMCVERSVCSRAARRSGIRRLRAAMGAGRKTCGLAHCADPSPCRVPAPEGPARRRQRMETQLSGTPAGWPFPPVRRFEFPPPRRGLRPIAQRTIDQGAVTVRRHPLEIAFTSTQRRLRDAAVDLGA